MTFTPAWKTN